MAWWAGRVRRSLPVLGVVLVVMSSVSAEDGEGAPPVADVLWSAPPSVALPDPA